MGSINWHCHLNRSGYAQAALDYINALKDSFNITISLLHAKADELSLSAEQFQEVQLMSKKEFGNIDVFHCIPDTQRRLKRRGKSIGFATFESDSPPPHWIDLLNSNDAVICPSIFNLEIFKKAGVKKPIWHVPHCVNTKMYDSLEKKLSNQYTFLFIGTWKRRKGWEHLIRAWFSEFNSNDNVRLVIKTNKVTLAQRDINKIKSEYSQSNNFAPIEFNTRIFKEKEIAQLIKNSDCVVLPTLGEGFGLPGLQAMAAKTPLIITDYSGPKDYITSDNCYKLNPKGMIVISSMDNIPQLRNQKWAYIDEVELAQKMRFALENRSNQNDMVNKALNKIHDDFSYDAIKRKFKEVIDTI